MVVGVDLFFLFVWDGMGWDGVGRSSASAVCYLAYLPRGGPYADEIVGASIQQSKKLNETADDTYDTVAMPPEEEASVQFLEPIGGTLRMVRTGAHAAGGPPRVAGVLVVGTDLPCQYWLSILPLARDPAMCHFVREQDLRAVADRLFVRPPALPAFYVAVNGYFVDAFPAPVPTPEHPVDPHTLLRAVREHLDRYAP